MLDVLLEPNFAPGLREPLWQCWATPGQIFAAWHLGITCHERHVWHMTPCEPSQHKYRSRTWQSRTSEVTWDDKCQHLSHVSHPHLSVNTGPWDRVLNTGPGQWRWLVEIWSGSWQHWHHYCLLKVYNTNKMWRWWGLVALGDGVTKVSWATHRHFLWSRHDHNCPHLPSSLGGLSCEPVFWLAASMQIIQSDVRIWQVSLLGGNVREGDGWAQNVPSASSLQCAAKPTVRHQSSSRAKKVLDSLSVLEL